MRKISARYLSEDERFQIADLRCAGDIVRGIAAQLGRAASTISREGGCHHREARRCGPGVITDGRGKRSTGAGRGSPSRC